MLFTTPNVRASGKCILRCEKFDVPDKFRVLVVMKEGGWLLSNSCGYLHKITILIFLTCLIFIPFQWNAFCLLLTCVCYLICILCVRISTYSILSRDTYLTKYFRTIIFLLKVLWQICEINFFLKRAINQNLNSQIFYWIFCPLDISFC